MLRLCTGLLAVLAAMLACNYPGLRASPQPANISMDALRLTATALRVDLPSQTPEAPSSSNDEESTLPTEEITSTVERPAMPEEQDGEFIYNTLPGDTLASLAGRFAVDVSEISGVNLQSTGGYLAPGALLNIPNHVGSPPYAWPALPDAEIIASPTSSKFNLIDLADRASGFLSSYNEIVRGRLLSGVEIVQLVSLETSVSPRLLVGLLEYRSGWLDGQPGSQDAIDSPMGFHVPGYRGLYHELTFTATQLNIGYYGWRSGTLINLVFLDGASVRLHPGLNAGSIAIQHLFAKWHRQIEWEAALYGSNGFLSRYTQRFGDPWERNDQFGSLLPVDLTQPDLVLPFSPGERWSFSGGPHRSWNTGTPPGAIDFSPVTGEPACSVSTVWVLAAAPGIITRSQEALVAVDLDGDNDESTGWVIIYFHIAEAERIPVGSHVNTDDHLGHPSCEGGRATGTHFHFARKYNGEWLPATEPVPMMLSGWLVQSGRKSYEGYLVQTNLSVAASPLGLRTSIIQR